MKPDSRSSATTVVPVNRPLALFLGAVAMFLVGMFGLVAISTSLSDEWGAYVENAVNLAVVVWLLGLFGSPRVSGAHDFLTVVNFLTVVKVPASKIIDVSAENGLSIVLDDGTSVDCVVHGASLLQSFFARVRPTRSADSVRRWVRDRALLGGQDPAPGPVRSTVRLYVWCGLPVMFVPALAYMAVVKKFADPLRGLWGVEF